MGVGRRYLALSALISFIGAVQMACHPASAQDFYKGKTLTMVVGYTAGGGFDLNARLLAQYIGNYIPGRPAVIVQNMPGAGSMTSVQYLTTTAPQDGTVITTFDRGLIGQSRFTPEKVPFDFRKFAWIGSISNDFAVCYAWHTLGVKTLDDLKRHKNLHFGLSGVGTNNDIYTRILKSILGVDVQEVGGYPGNSEERLAVERGELDGNCSDWSTLPEDWIRNHLISLVDAVAGLVGIRGGVVSGLINLESSGVGASDRRPRHDERYHEDRIVAAPE